MKILGVCTDNNTQILRLFTDNNFQILGVCRYYNFRNLGLFTDKNFQILGVCRYYNFRILGLFTEKNFQILGFCDCKKFQDLKKLKIAPIRKRFRFLETALLSDQWSPPNNFYKSSGLPRYNELDQIS